MPSNSTPNTRNFSIEFFSNGACNPSGYGEGQTFLGSTTVNTDGNGNARFDVTLPVGTTPGDVMTATATDDGGDTSEFSTITRTPSGGGGGGHPPATATATATDTPVAGTATPTTTLPSTDTPTPVATDTSTPVPTETQTTEPTGTQTPQATETPLYGISFSFLDPMFSPVSITLLREHAPAVLTIGVPLFGGRGAAPSPAAISLRLDALLLILALMFSVGLIGVMDDLGKLIYDRLSGGTSTIRVHGANFVFAVISVALSRLLTLTPGMVFGNPGGLEGDVRANPERASFVAIGAVGATFRRS